MRSTATGGCTAAACHHMKRTQQTRPGLRIQRVDTNHVSYPATIADASSSRRTRRENVIPAADAPVGYFMENSGRAADDARDGNRRALVDAGTPPQGFDRDDLVEPRRSASSGRGRARPPPSPAASPVRLLRISIAFRTEV
jgi:hypothetical protein